MGGLKPIGSEKLEGMDKIRRIMEIARYNENIPQVVNETKSTEYSVDMADGKTYLEAIGNAEIVINEWIETASSLGRTIPEPKGRLKYA